MGGTSTDVSRFDGGYQREYETEKAGVRIVAPMMAIETVAAGGGSVCRFDGVKLTVGPASAAADPGPACYGRGGPLAVTDMNLYQGKILAEHFPFPLDARAVEARLQALCREIAAATGRHYGPHELADGFLRVANAKMVQAIRTISIAKGADPRQYVLVAFGGAAGQHACAVARELGIRRVLCSPDAGVLSAYGIGMADVVRHRAAGVYRPYGPAALADLETAFQRMTAEARDEVAGEGFAAHQVEVRRLVDLRYRGLDSYLTIAEPASGSYAAAYTAEHDKLYGYVHEGRELEIVAARVEAVARAGCQLPPSLPATPREAAPPRTVAAWFDAQPQPTGVFVRDRIRPGDVLRGPAIVCEPTSTTVVDPDWQAEVLSGGELLVSDNRAAVGQVADVGQASSLPEHHVVQASGLRGSQPTGDLPHGSPPATATVESDPVMLEVFNNHFAGIAEQMGVTLRNTATSVNVKERLDFSCALFTLAGDLVVNAPHIPVHLGSMSETVRQIVVQNPVIRPGDVFVTNDPYRGGSHLPDVTVVTPLHDPHSGELLFFTASRAHHAEIGGKTPGSMPPFSTNLAEEGAVIENVKLIDAGCPRFDRLEAALVSGPYPTRNLHDNLADIAAQVAANRQGARFAPPRGALLVGSRAGLHGPHSAGSGAEDARCAGPAARGPLLLHRPPRRWLADRRDGHRRGTGSHDRLHRHGTGLARQPERQPGDRHRGRHVLPPLPDPGRHSAEPRRAGADPAGAARVPAESAGRALARTVPGSCRRQCRDLAARRRRDPGALNLAAASQGTMNNLLFGDLSSGYYETICGGAGATPAADGADAVHTHMTNTRATDPEVLEQRYPVRLWEFSIRRGSGAQGGAAAATARDAASSSWPSWRSRCSPSAAAPTRPMASKAASPAPPAATSFAAPTARPRSCPRPLVSPPIPATR